MYSFPLPHQDPSVPPSPSLRHVHISSRPAFCSPIYRSHAAPRIDPTQTERPASTARPRALHFVRPLCQHLNAQTVISSPTPITHRHPCAALCRHVQGCKPVRRSRCQGDRREPHQRELAAEPGRVRQGHDGGIEWVSAWSSRVVECCPLATDSARWLTNAHSALGIASQQSSSAWSTATPMFNSTRSPSPTPYRRTVARLRIRSWLLAALPRHCSAL